MIYITQLNYVIKGREELFYQFEDAVIPIMWKYNGQLILRIRPTNGNFVQNSIEPPFEIHIIAFDSEKDFEQFQQDEQRKKYLHLKEQSVSKVVLIKGVQI
jgi:uncharacterized protein (DUF1330 family)